MNVTASLRCSVKPRQADYPHPDHMTVPLTWLCKKLFSKNNLNNLNSVTCFAGFFVVQKKWKRFLAIYQLQGPEPHHSKITLSSVSLSALNNSIWYENLPTYKMLTSWYGSEQETNGRWLLAQLPVTTSTDDAIWTSLCACVSMVYQWCAMGDGGEIS